MLICIPYACAYYVDNKNNNIIVPSLVWIYHCKLLIYNMPLFVNAKHIKYWRCQKLYNKLSPLLFFLKIAKVKILREILVYLKIINDVFRSRLWCIFSIKDFLKNRLWPKKLNGCYVFIEYTEGIIWVKGALWME